jgi:hypothetical protein
VRAFGIELANEGIEAILLLQAIAALRQAMLAEQPLKGRRRPIL